MKNIQALGSPNVHRENGIALIAALMVVLLVMALGGGLVLTTSVEAGISWRYRVSQETLYAAQAAAERAMAEVVRVGDLNSLLAGSALSTFVDGPTSGPRTLTDGSVLDLSVVVNMANCEKATPCSASEMDAATDQRPWGPNNPRWRLYAFGPLKQLLPSSGSIRADIYVVVLVADDPFENDSDPTRDGTDTSNPGAGVVALRAEAFGIRGAHRVVELTATHAAGPRMLSWREVR